MMKAIRVREFGDPEVMTVEEVPDPKPGPGQVVVKIRAIGTNPVETYIRSGIYHLKPPLPYTPGNDAAGIVESIGKGVTRVSVGDRVYTAGSITGAYAEQALCDAAQVHPLPKKISFSQGAAINIPYSAAYHALFHRARAVPGEVVLVHGATGGVGVSAVQWARAAGLTVIATGGTQEGRRLLTEQGAHYVLDHKAPNHLEEALTLTNGGGVDVILEMLANVNLGTDLPVLAMDGRVVIIGSRGPVEINPRDAMTRNASILGMLLMTASEREIFSIHAAISAGLENDTLRPLVGKELKLADAPRAHRLLMESSAYGKIVLIP
ncbi:MAG: NADPH:quinone reductase [Desulfobacteraceae bacterium]|nr:MAG: NADPH:quinone reductase [Desulfobacteraceae bacterium]